MEEDGNSKILNPESCHYFLYMAVSNFSNIKCIFSRRITYSDIFSIANLELTE